MKKPKIYTLKSAKKECWDAFSKYVRTRDCIKTTGNPEMGVCITCPRKYPLKGLQAGHFVGGRHNNNLFSEKGVHAQCYYCNMTLKGNTLEYRRKVIELYGEGADEQLEAEEKIIRKFTIPELLEMAQDYRDRTCKLLNSNELVI